MERIVAKFERNLRIEVMSLKAENQELKNEVGEKNLRIYHLQKENESLRSTFKWIEKVLDERTSNLNIACK